MNPYQSFVEGVRKKIPGLYQKALEVTNAEGGFNMALWYNEPQTGYAGLGQEAGTGWQTFANTISSIADTYLQSRQADKRLKYDAQLQKLQLQLGQRTTATGTPIAGNLSATLTQWLPWILIAGGALIVLPMLTGKR